MCGGAIEDEHMLLRCGSMHFKTKEICDKAAPNDLYSLVEFVHKHFKTQQICNKAVKN